MFMNVPVQVHMLGFESDTARLQACGWQVAAEQDPMDQHLRIMIHDPRSGIYMMSQIARFEFMSLGHDRIEYLRSIVLDLTPWLKDQTIRSVRNPFGEFQMVDTSRGAAQQSWATREDFKAWSLEDCFVFPLAQPDHEVIVKPQEVPELLKLILSRQQPKVKEVLDNQRRREARGEVDKALTTRSHAQIISIEG